MSGWDKSSRPTWDPEGESGDSTQAFSTPDHSETSSDPWPEYGRDAHDQGGYRPQGASEQDHARRDYEPPDFAGDYSRPGAASEYGSRDYPSMDRADRTRADAARPDWDRPDWDRPDWDRPDWERPDWERPAWDRPDWDRPDSEPASRDYRPGDYTGRDADPNQAARRDPALQDFFAPRPTRQDPAQPGPGQRNGARGPGVPGHGPG